MRIGIGLAVPSRPDSFDQVLERFAQAEAAGFRAVWIAGALGYDALTLAALGGTVTRRVELGTFVVPTFPRHPVVMAQQALTCQAATANRLTLGIGLSHRPVIEGRFGLDFSRPVRHMREYLTVLTGLLAGEAVQFQGSQYRVSSQVRIPGAERPPVLVAALGPQMLRVAGTLADGTAVWMGGPKYLESTAVPLITQAAREAGRPAPRVLAGFPIVVTDKRDQARATASRTFAGYGTLPSYRAALDVEGAADPADVAIVGNEGEVERQLRRLAEIGVTDFNAVPFNVPDDPDARARTQQFLADLARAWD